MKTAQKTIDNATYLQLLGLGVLADRYNRQLCELEKAAAELLDVPAEGINNKYYGHVSDWIYGSREIDQMLANLDFKVDK